MALTLPIEKPFQGFLDALSEQFEGKPVDVTEENLQSRARGVTLDNGRTIGDLELMDGVGFLAVAVGLFGAMVGLLIAGQLAMGVVIDRYGEFCVLSVSGDEAGARQQEIAAILVEHGVRGVGRALDGLHDREGAHDVGWHRGVQAGGKVLLTSKDVGYSYNMLLAASGFMSKLSCCASPPDRKI